MAALTPTVLERVARCSTQVHVNGLISGAQVILSVDGATFTHVATAVVLGCGERRAAERRTTKVCPPPVVIIEVPMSWVRAARHYRAAVERGELWIDGRQTRTLVAPGSTVAVQVVGEELSWTSGDRSGSSPIPEGTSLVVLRRSADGRWIHVICYTEGDESAHNATV